MFCQRLRELSDEHGRTICVVDDGYETYPGHATIGFSQTVAAAPKNVQTAAKAEMIDMFKEAGVIRLEDCIAA